MEKDICILLTEAIKASLQDLQLPPIPDEELYLDFPADSRYGELSSNAALRLSKQAKKPPLEIAGQLIQALEKRLATSPCKKYIQQIKTEGAGFINFYLSADYFQSFLDTLSKEGSGALRRELGREKKALLEFVSANPTGSLSVAHARQAAVGDALANILDFLGFKVSREYYLNDEGNQINILGASVDLRMKELAGEKIEFPENYYQGDYIYDIAKKASISQLPASNLGDFAADYILEIIKKELDDFGVKFDCWYSQKTLETSGKIKEALDFLRARGFIYEQDGATWFKSTEFGDDKDRVVIKSDRTYTYLAPDIAYHKDKFQRGFEWLINFWGPDHHGYINRLKASVQAMGKPKDALSVIIVQLATIFRAGKPVQMSTRKGQYITLREVLDEVGVDAARFFFIMRRVSSHLDFDLEVAKKETSENPVYYVQYAYARICSILKANPGPAGAEGADLSLLKEKEELELIKKLWQFPMMLQACLKAADPYMLTVYLQEAAEAFHKFYDRHRVLGQEAALTQARIALLLGVKVVIAAGLELAGVSRPEKM